MGLGNYPFTLWLFCIHIQYLGSKEVTNYRGSNEAKDAIRELRKKGSKSKVTVTLHMKGLAVKDEKAKVGRLVGCKWVYE